MWQSFLAAEPHGDERADELAAYAAKFVSRSTVPMSDLMINRELAWETAENRSARLSRAFAAYAAR